MVGGYALREIEDEGKTAVSSATCGSPFRLVHTPMFRPAVPKLERTTATDAPSRRKSRRGVNCCAIIWLLPLGPPIMMPLTPGHILGGIEEETVAAISKRPLLSVNAGFCLYLSKEALAPVKGRFVLASPTTPLTCGVSGIEYGTQPERLAARTSSRDVGFGDI